MGFWSSFFGTKIGQPLPGTGDPPALVPEELRGAGTFGLPIVGESQYQGNIERAAGGRRREGLDLVRPATLVLEDENRYDRNAVRVDVLGLTAGYLTRDKAKKYRARLAEIGQPRGLFVCEARIVCGPDRGDGVTRSFGVWLDVDLRKR